MSQWTDGYVADIGYTYGYYTELNPLRQRLAFLLSGMAIPEIRTACELGYGQGISVNMHAAASSAQWYGNDFNPAQAAFAKELAAISGAGAELTDESFAEMARRSDLPKFDYIGLHGIWSWISDANRSTIVEFIRSRLNVGGVLYISYNTLPGWSSFAPVRHLLSLHAQTMGGDGQGRVERIDGSFGFAEELLATNPIYSKHNPVVLERFKAVNEQNRNYVAHEYFNRDWLPMHFSTMAAHLESAKLQYACSAHYLDHIDVINYNSQQQEFLVGIKDYKLRETTRDFLVNQSFRRDYWVKGARKIDAIEQVEQLRAQKVILVKYRQDVPLRVTVPVGEVGLNEPVYGPILDFLADHKLRTLGQIEQAVVGHGIDLAQISQAIMVLAGCGHVLPAQDADAVNKAKKNTERINSELIRRARGNADVQHLSSPVTGGGVPVQRFHQLFLTAIAQGRKHPADWAQFVWLILSGQGQSIIKEGKTLATPEENLQELIAQATDFEKKNLPVLKALMIAA